MPVQEGLSFEEQTYYACSMNTMRIVEVDRLFSENDKLCLAYKSVNKEY